MNWGQPTVKKWGPTSRTSIRKWSMLDRRIWTIRISGQLSTIPRLSRCSRWTCSSTRVSSKSESTTNTSLNSASYPLNNAGLSRTETKDRCVCGRRSFLESDRRLLRDFWSYQDPETRGRPGASWVWDQAFCGGIWDKRRLNHRYSSQALIYFDNTIPMLPLIF